jgi:hypothetical protein
MVEQYIIDTHINRQQAISSPHSFHRESGVFLGQNPEQTPIV